MRLNPIFTGVTVFACCGFLTVLHAATLSITSTADTGMFEDFPDNNLGSARTVASGTLAGNLGRDGASRMLLKFDLAGQLPAGASINAASVTLRVAQTPSIIDVDSTFGLHRLRVDWDEGTKALGLSSGSGSLASTGEATWNSRFHNQVTWTSSGGAIGIDYAQSASSSTPISGVATYTFASSSGMVADVQAWADAPTVNDGWILISESEGTLRTARRFATRESLTTAFRPTLTIDYSLPLRIENVAIADGTILMSFTAQQGTSYEVQRRENVGSGMWVTYTNIGPVIISGPVIVSDTADQPARFYQVVAF